MLIVLSGGGQDHINPSEWKLRWKKGWEPEPPKWRWWDLVIIIAVCAFLFWLLRDM